MRNIVLMRVLLYVLVGILLIILLHSYSPVRYFSTLLIDRSVNKTNNGPVFKTKPLVIWSNDYHIAPINDLKHLLRPLGVTFIDKSLSGHCHITNTCGGKHTLKVIGQGNAMNLDPSLIPKFYEHYRNDTEMEAVDAFGCFLPPAMCELFEPFNRSLIIVVPTRYEAGRLNKERWSKWNENLIKYSQDPKNVIAGNNLYDVEYVKYFTGIQPLLLPSFCGYITETYTPSRPGFLVAPIHHGGLSRIFFDQLAAICPTSNCTVQVFALRGKYPHYKYTDLTAHQGMIYVPYQVSVMSFFEQYRMNIPVFCPSVNLLSTWQFKHMVMNERTWAGVHGQRPARSVIDPHPSQAHLPDPNNEQNETAIRYWVKFSDYYQLPHVTYYDSVEHLVQILTDMTASKLVEISRNMREYNEIAKKDLTSKWTEILQRIAKYSKNHPH